MSGATSPIKWVGGKGRLLAELRGLRPIKFGRYFEPFLGGGAHFLDLGHGEVKSFLSDANADLILTWRAIRDDPDGLTRHLDELSSSVPYTRPSYEAIRREYNEQAQEDGTERAAWFIYLNKTGFNGLYRVNRKGLFNVPFGKTANGERPALHGEATIALVSRALQGAELHCSDFRGAWTIGRGPLPDDFVYLDPPYVPASITSDFTGYTAGKFGESAQRDLAREFVSLAERGVLVLASNSDTPLVRQLYDGFPMTKVTRSGSVSCNVAKRQRVGELIIRSHEWPTAVAS